MLADSQSLQPVSNQGLVPGAGSSPWPNIASPHSTVVSIVRFGVSLMIARDRGVAWGLQYQLRKALKHDLSNQYVVKENPEALH